MTVTRTYIFLCLAFATIQAAFYAPPAYLPTPYIPTLPPYVDVPPIVDYQSYTALSCGCNNPTAAPYGYGPPTVITSAPCSCSATVDCRVPTCSSLPPVLSPPVPYSPCGLPTVPYNPYPSCGCGCGLPTPLLPPLPPVIGCPKFLRQVCVQPPFL